MIFVTSDLHGYSPLKFNALLNKAGFKKNDTCYVLGDVIDRGKHGADLLKFLMNEPAFRLILGNHEAMMCASSFLLEDAAAAAEKLSTDNIRAFSQWLSNGGQPTVDGLRAFTKEERNAVFEYVRSAPLYAAVKAGNRDFILIHSGLGNFSATKKLSEYTPDELLWSRPLPDDRYYNDIMTVFGHTPTVFYDADHEGRAYITDTWINIDTGAAAGLDPCVLCLDTLELTYA